MPSSATTARRTRPRSSTTRGPRPRLSSSTRRTWGWRARARARATMRCSPPERSPARRPRRSARAGKRSTARAVSAATARRPPATARRRFSATDSWVNSDRSWGTHASPRRAATSGRPGGTVVPRPGPRRRGAGQGAGDGQHGRRLARPVEAEEGHDLARADGEVDVVDHLGAAVAGGQPLDLEHRRPGATGDGASASPAPRSAWPLGPEVGGPDRGGRPAAPPAGRRRSPGPGRGR